MSGSNQALSFSAPQFPLDKIFYEPEPGTISVAQSANPASPTIVTTTIPNPQNTTFFMDMQTSTDGLTWYDTGLEPYYYDAVAVGLFQRFSGYWYMTATTISLGFYANDASYTLHYRLVGYSKD